MKKSTKGAIAAAAAGVLLLGGAGTLAYWTAETDTSGTTINSGHLALTGEDCGAGWTLDGGDPFTNQPLVPGDTLTKTCTYTLDIAGEHFDDVDFTVTPVSLASGSQAIYDELTITPTVELNNVAQASATDVAVQNGDTVEVGINVLWNYGTEDNDSNNPAGLQAVLSALSVEVKQNHL